jgi:3-isopropylmalate/(R)-2-methylmalate dehydratase large subunit
MQNTAPSSRHTLTEKLLARGCGAPVAPGMVVQARLDRIFMTDITAPGVLDAMDELGVDRVAEPERVAIFLDHLQPAKDEASARIADRCRRFARAQGIERVHEPGGGGISHVVLAEGGWLRPGQLVVGTDSHTTALGALGAFAVGVGATDLALALRDGSLWFRVPPTVRVDLEGALPAFVTGKDLSLLLMARLGLHRLGYRALELGGSAPLALHPADRATLCNMAAELGVKNAVIPAAARGGDDGLEPDEGARYEERLRLEVGGLEPLVLLPDRPGEPTPIGDPACRGVRPAAVMIGGCTEGELEHFRRAAALLKGRRIAPGLRLSLHPGSHRVLADMTREGVLATLLDSGALLCPPSCGPCIGGHLGVLGPGEVAVCTFARNTPGRLGSRDARVVLGNAQVAAAAALAGELVHPGELA